MCIEGLVQALKVFLNEMVMPEYRCIEPCTGNKEKIIMTESTQRIRKYCVGAVLRNVDLTEDVYNSFIDLQVGNRSRTILTVYVL